MAIRYFNYYSAPPTDQCGVTGTPFYRSSYAWGQSGVVRQPEWAQRKTRPGIYVPPTPFDASERYTNSPLAGIRRGGTFKCNGIAQIGFGPDSASGYAEDSAAAARHRSLAVIKARKQLKNQNVNAAVAFAERRKTANMVAQKAIQIARAGWALRKGNFAGAAAALGLGGRKSSKAKGVAKQWLELQYGWKPLLGDVYGGMVELHRRDVAQPDRYRVNVKGHSNEKIDQVINTSPGTDLPGIIVICSVDKSVIVSLDYCLGNSYLAGAARLGLTNPLELAWELVPFSFVADWFVPVGAYLSSLDADLGWTFLGGFSTYHQYGVARVVDNGPNGHGKIGPKPEDPASWLAMPGDRTTKFVRRIPYSSSPVPRFPGLKSPFSSAHALNAIALVASAFR